MIPNNLKLADRLSYQIQAMRKNPIKNAFKIRKLKRLQVQALNEGGRDPLNTSITDAKPAAQVVDKNNYTEYSGMVDTAYKMYNAEASYGASIFSPLVDTRVAIIGGDGLNVNAKKPATRKFIESFLKMNKLNGSGLIRSMRIGEMEGKDLLVLSPKKLKDDDKKLMNGNQDYIAVNNFSWHELKYKVDFDSADGNTPTKITYSKNGNESEEVQTVPLKSSVYVQLGGVVGANKTVHKCHKILTQCENLDRAGYDLRNNSHLFGKIAPNWYLDPKTFPGWEAEATAISNKLSSDEYQIGQGYAGPADFNFKAPPGDGVEILIKDILTSLKLISSMTGIPIHWLSWPELMSNRATAENISKMLEISSRAERLIWEEAFTELIEKAMLMAVDKLGFDNNIIGDFTVTLPTLQIEDVFEMLEKLSAWVGTYISRETFMNRIPRIDPITEDKRIKKENEERAEDTPSLTSGVDPATIQRMQEEAENGNDEND